MPTCLQIEADLSGVNKSGRPAKRRASLLRTLGVAVVLCGLGGLTAAAQDCGHHHHYYDDDWHCDRHWRSGDTSGDSARYGGNTQTLHGRIAEIVYLPGVTPDSGMVELRLAESGQATRVQLAPVGFLKHSGILLKEGDAITVKGMVVSGFQGDLVVTVTLQSGDKSVALRDLRGRPLW